MYTHIHWCVPEGNVSSFMLMGLDFANNSRLVKQEFVWLPGSLQRLSCAGSAAAITVIVQAEAEHLCLSPALCCTQRESRQRASTECSHRERYGVLYRCAAAEISSRS